MKKLLILTVSILLIAGCDNDDSANQEPAPEIPPLSTFLMEFDIVDANSGRVAAMDNWGYSALNVLIWNSVITVTLAIPLATFANAFEQEPTFDSSLPGWTWEYDVAAFNNTYNARLQAQITGTTIEWDMFVTDAGVFEDFNWYSGSSALDGLSGTWTLNKAPEDPTPFLEIEWTRDANGETGTIKYTNIETTSTNNGNHVFFETDNAGEFDRNYEIFTDQLQNTTEIEWDSVNKDGQVKDPNHFGDEDFHCWDEELEDIVCPV